MFIFIVLTDADAADQELIRIISHTIMKLAAAYKLLILALTGANPATWDLDPTPQDVGRVTFGRRITFIARFTYYIFTLLTSMSKY